MNHIYRIIWSQAANAWVAVAETSSGRGKSSSCKLVAAAVSLTAALAQANPLGATVVSGAATIVQSAIGGAQNTTINQSTPTLSLTWKSFNIAQQESVNFIQPSSSSIAVNRIYDTNGSQILGRLNANGQVYLINPNGIVFGADAQVNVGALVASTLNLNDASLNSSSKTFSTEDTADSSASVINHGTINAANGGYVALLGNTVSNQGSINVPLGFVALGAGNSSTLTFVNNSLVAMQVDQSVVKAQAENGGLIHADGGMVLISAGSKNALLASVVNNSGIIEARTVQNHAGSITLLGGMVAGTVNLAGTLDASAPTGGNGGAIETSAAQVKVADGAKITTAAAAGSNGVSGNWLVDPTNFSINAGSAAQTGSGIGATTLANSLASSNVTLTTASASNGSDLGDINVNAAVSWSANKLTLNAANNINFNANLNGSGTASLALLYGMGASATGNLSSYKLNNNAQINLPAGANFSSQLGADGSLMNFTVINSLGATGSLTGADLQGMNGNLAANYALGGNIDASSTAFWGVAGFMPIGVDAATFTGSLDGLGHSITGLTINRSASTSVGLIGNDGASAGSFVQNLNLINSKIVGGAGTGSLMGNNLASNISNITSTGNVKGTSGTGGLVGISLSATISNNNSSVNVTGNAGTGGLVGTNTTGAISGNITSGTVKGAAGTGGLLGANTTGAITGNTTSGNVTGNAGTGGLIGSSTTGVITQNAATGNVSGAAGTGGLIGSNTTGAISKSYAGGTVIGSADTGGLVGNTTGSISDSYATGDVSNVGNAAGGGGLVGTTTNNITNSYATSTKAGTTAGLASSTTGQVSGSFWNIVGPQTSTGGGIALSTSQLQTKANFTAATSANNSTNPSWDFGTTWVMYDGLTMPMLRSFMTPLQISANNASKTYNGASYTTPYSVSYSAASTINSQNLLGTLSVSGSAVSASNAGAYGINLSGMYSNQQGYLITYVPGMLTINPAVINLSGVRTFDGSSTLAASIFTLSGLVNGESLNLTGAGSALSKNVGTDSVSLGSLQLSNASSGGNGSASNYTLTGGTPVANVLAAPLTIYAGMVSKVYDGTLSALGTGMVTSGALFGSDVLSSGGLSFTNKNAGTDNKTLTANGVSVVDGNGTASANYKLTYVNNYTSSIMPKTLNVTAVAANKVYDGKTTASVTLADDRVSGDVLKLSLPPVSTAGTFLTMNTASGASMMMASGSAGANFADKNVGSNKLVWIAGIQVTGVDAGNYTANTATTALASITPKAIVVSAVGLNKYYDGTKTDLVTLSSAGMVAGDNLLLSGSASFLDTAAGAAKAVTVTSLSSSGADVANYTISNLSASTSATIVPKPITVLAVGLDKTYDGSINDQVTLSSVGILAQDLNNVALSSTATFANKNVGIGKSVSVSHLGATGSQAANYTITNSTAIAHASILQKIITVTANANSKVYDGGSSDSVTMSSNGIVSGDSITFTDSSALFSDKNVGIGKTVAISGIAVAGKDALNYAANNTATSSASISAKAITVVASGGNKVYDATVNAAVTLSSTGVVAGDNISFKNSSALFDNKNVGTGKLVTVSGISALGGDIANYRLLNTVTTAKANVTPKFIVVTATGIDKIYNGNSNDAVSLQSTGVIAGDTIAFSDTSAIFANSAAGIAKAVTVFGISAIGVDAANYSVLNKTTTTWATVKVK